MVTRGDPPSILLLVALFAAAIVVGALLGCLLEVGLLRRVQGKDPILQLLITFGAFLILDDVQLLIWGGSPYTASEVSGRLGTIELFGVTYTAYQLVLIPIVALCAYGLLQYFLRYTRTGRQVVAVTHNAEVATALGIHAKRIRLVTFIVGAILGALGGALSVPTTSLVPGVGADMIVLSFSVVATAGLGQITGALIAALIIGMARSLAVYTFPEFEVVVPYVIMVLVLLIRPYGLFTVAQARKI
jgi:branched-chain amino acid transport system permease protein